MLKDYSSDRSRRRPTRSKRLRHAAVFVDFESVYYSMASAEALPTAEDPAVDVQALDDGVELLSNLADRLKQRHSATVTMGRAFADFDRIGGDAQSQLQLIGFEPRFSLAADKGTAVDTPLCIEAMEALLTRPEIDLFVLVGASRSYVPLVRRLREHMKRVVVVAFDKAVAEELRGTAGNEHFLSAEHLLPNADYEEREIPNSPEPTYSSSAPREETPHANGDSNGEGPASDEDLTVCMEELLNAFYQYGGRKVWLTPFLRLLNERFPYLDNRGRKRMVEGLQSRGAISIEKIDGDPYPYSVVEINWENHWVQGMDEARGNG